MEITQNQTFRHSPPLEPSVDEGRRAVLGRVSCRSSPPQEQRTRGLNADQPIRRPTARAQQEHPWRSPSIEQAVHLRPTNLVLRLLVNHLRANSTTVHVVQVFERSSLLTMRTALFVVLPGRRKLFLNTMPYQTLQIWVAHQMIRQPLRLSKESRLSHLSCGRRSRRLMNRAEISPPPTISSWSSSGL
jgi:hypothetical protein